VPSLKELPSRRPQPPAPESAIVQWDRVDIDRYLVTVGGDAVGFIDVVGAVFVVLAGPRYDRAVEVLQTLDFATAIGWLSPVDAERADPSPTP
jgi:hypothetical protein